MNVFDWHKSRRWYSDTINIIINLWGKNFIDRLKRNELKPNLYDEQWLLSLLQIPKDRTNKRNPIIDFTMEVRSEWDIVKVYHASRVKDISDFCSKGIVAPTIEDLDLKLVEIIHPYVCEKTLIEMLKLLHYHFSKEDEYVFVAIDKNHLRTFCNHHLEYGSEYLLTGIMLLKKFGVELGAFLKLLKESRETTPVIFECDIPFNHIAFSDALELSTIILTESCKMLLESNYFPLSRRTSLKIENRIKPEWIKDYSQPIFNESMKITPPIWIDIDKIS